MLFSRTGKETHVRPLKKCKKGRRKRRRKERREREEEEEGEKGGEEEEDARTHRGRVWRYVMYAHIHTYIQTTKTEP